MTIKPDAWLIREIKNGKTSVLYGHMFKSKEAAEAAALRMTNQWRFCVAFPVTSSAYIDLRIETLKHEVVETIEPSMAYDEAYRKLKKAIKAFVAAMGAYDEST